MQIVIDIPKEIKQKRDAGKVLSNEEISTICMAIKNGTPLPKGHRRLVDAEELLDAFWTYCNQGDFGYHQAEDLIKSAPTIIEADGGEAE